MKDSIIHRKKKNHDKPEIRRNRYNPFPLMRNIDDIFDSFRRDFDDMVINPFRRFHHPMVSGEDRAPTMDFLDKGDKFILTAEVPGISKEDLDISITDHNIEIKGEHKEESEEKDEDQCYYCRERSYSSFHRAFEFPEEISADDAKARMENGVVKIELPKKEPEPEKGVKKLTVD